MPLRRPHIFVWTILPSQAQVIKDGDDEPLELYVDASSGCFAARGPSRHYCAHTLEHHDEYVWYQRPRRMLRHRYHRGHTSRMSRVTEKQSLECIVNAHKQAKRRDHTNKPQSNTWEKIVMNSRITKSLPFLIAPTEATPTSAPSPPWTELLFPWLWKRCSTLRTPSISWPRPSGGLSSVRLLPTT